MCDKEDNMCKKNLLTCTADDIYVIVSYNLLSTLRIIFKFPSSMIKIDICKLLELAIINHNVDMVKMILEYDRKNNTWDAYIEGCKFGISCKRNIIFRIACYSCNYDIIKRV